jgi:hypothetical protein
MEVEIMRQRIQGLKRPSRQMPRQRVKAQKSEHVRVDTRPTRRFPHPLEHLGPHGTLKDVNASNPMLHPHKEHKKGEHLFAQQDATPRKPLKMMRSLKKKSMDDK